MEIFLFTFIIMTIAVLGMAVGVLLGRNPLKGSCGGLNGIEGLECEICTQPCAKKKRAMKSADNR